MSLQIRLIGEDSRIITYGYKTEYDKVYFHFDKKQKTVAMSYMRFVRKNDDGDWTTQNEDIKYSCKYGHWQAEVPTINQREAEFICQTLKELKGGAE